MKQIQALLDEIASEGRNGDTMIAHINPQEAELLKSLGGSGTINPKTGLPEFWGFSIGPVGIGSDYGGVSVGGTSTGDLANKALNIAKDTWDTAKNTTSGVLNWVKENPLEAAALAAAGYYFSPQIGAWIGSDGAAIAGTEAGTSVGASELTAAEVNSMIAAEQAANMSAAETLAAIEAEQAASTAAAAATPAQAAAAKAAGMSLIDYAKAGLLVNAIAGDPLGLGGSQGQQGGAASTGFAQVPIPAEWKSPTYAAPSAPIDLSTIFSNQNMLGGTQWQGLPSQQNMSFNDIFSAGQQQTPMGSPVDLNQIVSSILGQAATSQKPA